MCLSPALQGSAGTQFTCFTSRKVQILTQRLCGSAHMAPPSMSGDERWASEHLPSEPALASVSAGSSIEPIPAYRPVGGWDAVGGVGGGDRGHGAGMRGQGKERWDGDRLVQMASLQVLTTTN